MSLMSSPDQVQSAMSGDPNTNYGYSGTTGDSSPLAGGSASVMSPIARLQAMMNSPVFQALAALSKGSSGSTIPTMGGSASPSSSLTSSATPLITGSPFAASKSAGRMF